MNSSDARQGGLQREVLQKIQMRLSEIGDLLSLRIETAEEGKGRRLDPPSKRSPWIDTAPRWFDEEIGQLVRPWLMIPFAKDTNYAELADYIEQGKLLFESVSQQIDQNNIGLELVHDWGLLNRYAAAIELAYFREPDARQLRAGHDNLDAHRKWFSQRYLSLTPQHSRQKALEIMEMFINSLVAKELEEQKRQWLSKFLSEEDSLEIENAKRLTKAFREKLSVKQMKALEKEPTDGIPEFALHYPHPPLGVD